MYICRWWIFIATGYVLVMAARRSDTNRQIGSDPACGDTLVCLETIIDLSLTLANEIHTHTHKESAIRAKRKSSLILKYLREVDFYPTFL